MKKSAACAQLLILTAILPLLFVSVVNAGSCESLRSFAIEHIESEALARADIRSSSFVHKGYVFPADGFGKGAVAKIDFCRVKGVFSSGPGSGVNFEVWMPSSGWNRKFLGAGNGGFYGALNYSLMMDGLNRGYAVAGSDLGHSVEDSQDGSWALGNPEKLQDFSHRADHLTAIISKKIVAHHYSSAPDYSYFVGCSYGGRQALTEVQRYPGDYDGVVAVAPGINFVNIMININWYAKNTLAQEGRALSLENLRYLHKKVVNVCDSQDGLEDGLISDPMGCSVSIDQFSCGKENAGGCLEGRKISAIKSIYPGPMNRVTGANIYPGMMKGSEMEWIGLINGDKPAFNDALSVFAYQDKAWDWKKFDFGDDVEDLHRKIGFMNSLSTNLDDFRAGAGKIIILHGLADGLISPLDSINYHAEVRERYSDDIDGFMRLFLVPGMGHCAGGSGPNKFDALGALESWVERGSPPDVIVARKHLNDDPDGPVLRSRPLCKYPGRQQYIGSGSIDDYRSFICE